MVWTTKTGKRIPVSELTEEHAKNIISMLIRQNSAKTILSAILSQAQTPNTSSKIEKNLINEGIHDLGANSWDEIEGYSDWLAFTGK